MAKKKQTLKVKRYPTDLNDKKWEVIEPLLLGALSGGRPRKVSLRKLINAILSIVGVDALGGYFLTNFQPSKPCRMVIIAAGQKIKRGKEFTIHYAQKFDKKQEDTNIQRRTLSIAKV